MSSPEKLYDYDPASIQDPPDAAIAIHIRKTTTDNRLNDIDTTQTNDRFGVRCTCSAELWKRIGIVSLYMITITILYADMNILAPNLSIIADEFGMDDDERDVKLGGLIALGFFFVGAPMSYYIGALADSTRVNRSPLFAATVFFGEFGCLLAAFVQAYWQLYICRVMTGISVGGAIPVIYSVLGDLFPSKQRVAIAAIVTTGTGIGTGLGQVLAGFTASWRTPFILVSIPGLLCSFFMLFIEDPRRGAYEAAVLERGNNTPHQNEPSTLSEEERREKKLHTDGLNINDSDEKETLSNCGMDIAVHIPRRRDRVGVIDSEQSRHIIETDKADENIDCEDDRRTCGSCKDMKELWSTKSVVLTILQAAPGALPFGFCATFLNDYLQEQRGMTKENATVALAVFGAGNAIGVVIAGFLGHFAYAKDVRGPPMIMGLSLILGCIPFYFLINKVDENANTSVVAGLTILTGMLVVIPVPLERSILTNVCRPTLRGRANALVSIVDDLGKGLGPALVSLLITTFDRQTAFNISLVGWIIGGILSLMIMMFVKTDEEAVQKKIREELTSAMPV